MFSILIFSYLISIGFTYELSNNDILTDKLHSAALEVISMHSSSISCPDHLISIHNRSEFAPDPELMRAHKISEMMNSLKERFLFQQSYLQKVSDALKYAIRANANGIVITPNIIRNLTAFNGITVTQIKNLRNIFWQNSKLTVNDLKYKLIDLVNAMKNVEQRIRRVIQSTGDVVLLNRPSRITGHKKFVGHIEVLSLNTSTATIGSVGRQDLRQVMNNLYRKSRTQIVRGVKDIMKPTFVRHSINSNLINGIAFKKQIVTTNSPQIIKSLIKFDSQLSVMKDMTIKGNVNNLDLNRDLVFVNRPELVLAPKVFTSPLIIARRVNSLTIDGIDLSKLSKNVLLSNGLQTINSNLVLLKAFTTKSISVDGMVNNVDISAMAPQLVYKNRPVRVRGKKTFVLDSIRIKNDLFVGKELDRHLIPEDLLLRTRDQTITSPKHFRGITRFYRSLRVNGFVDGLRLPQDIVSLTKDEMIAGPVVFEQSISANRDIEAHRLVDGVDISELRLFSLKLNDKLIQSNVRFTRPVTVGSIGVNGDVNGVDLGFLFRDAIFRDSSRVEIMGTKFFEAHIEADTLFADRVNGINLTHLVSTNKNETIFGPKVLTGLSAFHALDVKGLVGRVNVENLYRNRISLSKPENIIGIKNFVNNITIKDWLSVKRINGIVPQLDIVLKSKFQVIKGPKIFYKTLNANNLIANNPTIVRKLIDNTLINDLSSRVVRLDRHQTIPLNIILINSNSTFVYISKALNGLNVTQFANNVMSVTKPQTVFAPKLFRNGQTFSLIRSFKGINRISLSSLKANAIYLNGKAHIRAPFTFRHPVVFNRPLRLNGVVNGVNLSYIALDAIYKTGQNVIYGKNIFKSGFRVNGNINALTLNGVNLRNELLTKTRDHVIRGKVTFTKTLHIDRDLILDGLINDLDLSEFNKKVMKINGKNIINGNLELNGPTVVLTNLLISGRLNGVNLTELFNNAVYMNSRQEINGITTLIAPIRLSGHLNTTDLNGFNVPQMLSDIVFIDSLKEQIIYSPKVFTNDIMANGLIQRNGITTTGPINRVNLAKLDSESIKVNRPTHLLGIQNFKNSTIIANNFTRIYGRINGIDLLKDVIHLRIIEREPQVIRGHKVFEHLVLNDNAIIDGLVNGFSLKAVESNTLFTTNVQRITGHKIFKGLLVLHNSNNMVRHLNGLEIPKDLVTLERNQSLFSHLIFNNQLFINKNLFVSGFVSGHNLTKLVTESLIKNKPQALAHPIKFDSVVFRQDVMVGQHVDNVDLSALSNRVKRFTSVANISKDLLFVRASRHHYVSDYLYKSLEKSVFEIDSFSLYQILDEIHGNHIDILANDVFTLSESIQKPQTVHSIRYNPKTELFDTSLINQNPLIIRETFVLNGEEFVLHMSSHSYNYSSRITKSGHLFATIGYFMNSVEILKVSQTKALIISFQSNTGKLMVHSIEWHQNKYVFIEITHILVDSDTSKVIAFRKDSQIYIAVAKHYGLHCAIDTTGTLIFRLKDNRMLELIQTLPVMNVVDVIHFVDNGRHYLALSDNTYSESSLNPQTIYIYRSDSMAQKCVFSLFQKLEFDNVIQLSAFTYGTTHSKHQYLMAANSSNVIVWKQLGESGFTENWLLQTKSTRILAPVIADKSLYLIVGQSYKCHESLIFRAETRGIALAPIVFKYNYI